MSDVDLPVSHVREQIASALDLIVHTTRTADGRRAVTAVTSIVGMRGGVIRTEEVIGATRSQARGPHPVLTASAGVRARLRSLGGSPARWTRTDPDSRGHAWAGTPRHLGTVLE